MNLLVTLVVTMQCAAIYCTYKMLLKMLLVRYYNFIVVATYDTIIAFKF